ncbi:hypothetical protein ACHAW6_000014 [Cyclotella cf. meneghiniana]
MIPNADIIGGACEEVVDILENIPSDNERRAATDVERRRGYRLRRHASFTIFRSSRQRQQNEDRASALSAEEEIIPAPGEQAAGEEPEEKRRIGVLDTKDEADIYTISSPEEQINPLSNDYVGIIANYFSVGMMVGGSTSLLYPVLIIKAGATSSLMTASYAIVMRLLPDCRVQTKAIHCIRLALLHGRAALPSP